MMKIDEPMTMFFKSADFPGRVLALSLATLPSVSAQEKTIDLGKERRSYTVSDVCDKRPEYECKIVEPRAGQAVNPNDNRKSIFVNGVNTTEADSTRASQYLADSFGRQFARIYNPTEGLAKDFANAAAGKLNPYTGLIEDSTWSLLFEVESLLGDPSAPLVDIHAHSHGSIIAANALYILRHQRYGHLEDAEWDAFCRERISVTTYGPAEHAFPVPEVTAFRHEKDPIVFLTDNPVLNSLVPYPYQPIAVETESPVGVIASHDFEQYVRSLPDLHALDIFHQANANGREAAKIFSERVAAGQYTSDFANRVIKVIATRTTEVVGQTGSVFNDFVSALKDSDYTIGQYRAPKNLQELLAAVSAADRRRSLVELPEKYRNNVIPGDRQALEAFLGPRPPAELSVELSKLDQLLEDRLIQRLLDSYDSSDDFLHSLQAEVDRARELHQEYLLRRVALKNADTILDSKDRALSSKAAQDSLFQWVRAEGRLTESPVAQTNMATRGALQEFFGVFSDVAYQDLELLRTRLDKNRAERNKGLEQAISDLRNGKKSEEARKYTSDLVDRATQQLGEQNRQLLEDFFKRFSAEQKTEIYNNLFLYQGSRETLKGLH